MEGDEVDSRLGGPSLLEFSQPKLTCIRNYRNGCPEKEYEGSNGVAALVERWYIPFPPSHSPSHHSHSFSFSSELYLTHPTQNSADELFKYSAYLTEAYYLNTPPNARQRVRREFG
jgi:hypothetical protein